MTKNTSSDTDPQLQAVKPDDIKPETDPVAVPSFADKVEDLMNHAIEQSIPAPNQPATEHHQKFAAWANALGDLLREVKQHAKS